MPDGELVDDERLRDEFYKRLRATALGTLVSSVGITIFVWLVVASKESASGIRWKASEIPALDPGTALSALAVAVVVLAAVAFSEPRLHDPATVEDLERNQLLRFTAVGTGAFAGLTALWGSIGAVTLKPASGAGEQGALAVVCITLGVVLVLAAGTIGLREPPRLRRLAIARTQRSAAQFAEGLTRWTGELPPLAEWRGHSFWSSPRMRAARGLALQLATYTLVATLLALVVLGALGRIPQGVSVLRRVPAASLIGAALASVVLFSARRCATAWTSNQDGRLQTLRRASSVLLLLAAVGVVTWISCLLPLPWSPVLLAPTAALVLRLLLPLLLRKRVPGVALGGWHAWIDHRFWVLAYYSSHGVSFPSGAEPDEGSVEEAVAVAPIAPMAPSTPAATAGKPGTWTLTLTLRRR